MANKRDGAIYTGLTSDLVKRVWQHRSGLGGFTTQQNCKLLAWSEQHATMEYAILREKQIKGGSRQKKLVLIESSTPQWHDLWAQITD